MSDASRPFLIGLWACCVAPLIASTVGTAVCFLLIGVVALVLPDASTNTAYASLMIIGGVSLVAGLGSWAWLVLQSARVCRWVEGDG